MPKLCVLSPLVLLVAAVVARPQTGATWRQPSDGEAAHSVARGALSGRQFVRPPFQGGFQPVARRGRRISDADTQNNLLSTTTPAPPKDKKTGSKLVTLRPIGNNIQEILFNNGYRKTPGDKEPQPNNIDNPSHLDGLSPEEVWLLDDDLLVLKGGSLKAGFVDTTPIDDYVAPFRQPKFPPPGFSPQGVTPPPGSVGAFFSDGRVVSNRQRQPEAFIPEYGYNPYGARTSRGSISRSGESPRPAGIAQPGYRAVLPPAGFTFGGTTAAATAPTPAPQLPRHSHTQSTYVKKNAAGLPAAFRRPAGFITSYDSLPRSFVSGAQYPAQAAATTLYNQNGNYMTYTNHDSGFSYSYKTDDRL